MNPFIGLSMLILGGISAGSCYVPLKKVSGWAWESLWTVQGLVAWLLLPLLLALVVTPQFRQVFSSVPATDLLYTYLFGFLWGIGGLAWGIAVRYIGIALGFTIATGFLSSLGTLVPIIAAGQLGAMMSTLPGKITLFSVLVSLIGIMLCGRAGMLRDREKQTAAAPDPSKSPSVFKKGIFIAFMAGVLAACFAFGIHAGDPIREKAIALGASPVWATSPVFFIELLGGITVNLAYCLWMNSRNHSFGDYTAAGPIIKNYGFSSLAGALWYLQFVFYGIAAFYMGRYSYTNWSIHMSFMVVASNLWGFYYGEWSGVRRKTFLLNIAGIVILVLSGIIMGIASYVKMDHVP